MNIASIKKFLTETSFSEIEYRAYSEYYHSNNYHPLHGGWHCYYFTTSANEGENYGKTLMIKFKEKLFDWNVVIYQNGSLVGKFKGLFVKWNIKQLIKQAFAKHFDEVIENWNKKK